MFFRKAILLPQNCSQHRETVDCMNTRLLLSWDTVVSIQFLETLAKELMVLFLKQNISR